MTGVAAALLLLSLPAAAQWKWRDASGHVQYSDLPPPSGTPDKDILNRPAVQRRAAAAALLTPAASAASASVASAASGALAPRTTDPELEAKRKKAEADQAAKVKAEEARAAAVKAENCSRARTQMTTLGSGVRLARVNEKGEREFLDDSQRAAESKRAQEAISSNCK